MRTPTDLHEAGRLRLLHDAVRSAIGAQRQPDNQILYERWLARTLALLDTKAYSQRYEDGRVLPLADACALALRQEEARREAV